MRDQFIKPRLRDFNQLGEISPVLGDWDRTVSFSDIVKWMTCAGMYLMATEGDQTYRISLSQEIGDLLHEETAKPPEERLQYTADIAARLQNVKPEDRQAVAQHVKNLIRKATRVSDRESIDAIVTEHERLMVWYDSYTDTFWYAKPDKMDVQQSERGSFLNVVDQKSGVWRKKLDVTGAFFFGYVAKMTGALDFKGPIRSIVRYLKDFHGNILTKPDEKELWIGRELSTRQQDELWGIQETVLRMGEHWKAKSFPLTPGSHCKRCQFRHSCPENREKFAEWQQAKTDRLAEASSLDQEHAETTPEALPTVLAQLVTITPAAQSMHGLA